MNQDTTSHDAFDFELKFTRIKNRASWGGGTWVSGTIDDEYRFDALVFAEHAENPEWELGDSRISKLWISRFSNKETSFNWDRGLDIPAPNKKVQAVVDFLCAGLADAIYAE